MASIPSNPELLKPQEVARKPEEKPPENLPAIEAGAEDIIAAESENIGEEKDTIGTDRVLEQLTPEERERLAQIPAESAEAAAILEKALSAAKTSEAEAKLKPTAPTTKTTEKKPATEAEAEGGGDYEDDIDQSSQRTDMTDNVVKKAEEPTVAEQREAAKLKLLDGIKSIDQYRTIILEAEQGGLIELRRTPDGKLLVFNDDPERSEPVLMFDSFDLIQYQEKLDSEQIQKLVLYQYKEKNKPNPEAV